MKFSITAILTLTSSLCMGQLTEIPDSWTVKEGSYEGKPLLIRKNTGMDNVKDRSFYKVRTGIAFQLKSANSNGLPGQEETLELYDLEDAVFEIFEKDNNAIVSVMITTNGIREFVIYSSSNDWSKSCFEQLKERSYGYGLTTYNELDPEWTVFEEY